jgi:hypothetical protein
MIMCHTYRHATTLLFWISVATACTAGSDSPPFITHDSSGVTIAESREPAWDTQTQWRVAEDPQLEIGVLQGDSAYQFDQIAGAVRLADGRIVVADGASSQIRTFDTHGRLLSVTGRRGGGPGEFEIIASLGAAGGDTVWVYDFSLRRVSFFTATGDLVGVASLGHEPPTLGTVGRLDDGSFVLAQLWGASRTAETTTLGLRRDPVVYARFSSRGELIDTIGQFPGLEINVTEENGRNVMGSALFGRSSSHATLGQSIFVGDQVDFEIGRYSASGELRGLIRLPTADLRISPQELEALKERQVEAAPSHQRASRRAYLDAVDVPETRPAYQNLLPDALGNLWASEYARPPDVPAAWTVVDPQGRWLGTVTVPPRFRPYQIGDSWILGVVQDELDVERLRLYELIKP